MLTAFALLIALVALFFSPNAFLEPVSLFGPLLILIAGAIGFVWQHRKLARFAAEPVLQRHADLTSAPERLPWFIWLAPGPFAMLSVAAGVLYSKWSSIPARFPVHWGLNGQPNRWNARTVHGVYGPVLAAAELCALLLIMGLATWFGARRSRFRRATLAALIACEYIIAVLFLPVAANTFSHSPMWLVILGPLVLIVPVIVMMVRALAEPDHAIEPTPNACWKAGMIYYNPDDSALFVEKRAGLGYTFNFANRWSWVLMLGLVLVISTLPLLM